MGICPHMGIYPHMGIHPHMGTYYMHVLYIRSYTEFIWNLFGFYMDFHFLSICFNWLSIHVLLILFWFSVDSPLTAMCFSWWSRISWISVFHVVHDSLDDHYFYGFMMFMLVHAMIFVPPVYFCSTSLPFSSSQCRKLFGRLQEIIN